MQNIKNNWLISSWCAEVSSSKKVAQIEGGGADSGGQWLRPLTEHALYWQGARETEQGWIVYKLKYLSRKQFMPYRQSSSSPKLLVMGGKGWRAGCIHIIWNGVVVVVTVCWLVRWQWCPGSGGDSIVVVIAVINVVTLGVIVAVTVVVIVVVTVVVIAAVIVHGDAVATVISLFLVVPPRGGQGFTWGTEVYCSHTNVVRPRHLSLSSGYIWFSGHVLYGHSERCSN